MSNQVNSLKKGLTVKDLVTTGIFSAIFFVFTLVGGLPFAPNPVLTFYMPMGAALLCGPIYLLMVAKVQKRWSVTILGIIMGIIWFATGMHWAFSLGYIGMGLIADLVAGAGHYRNKAINLLSYMLISLGGIYTYVVFFLDPDGWASTMLKNGTEQSYIDTMNSSAPSWLLVVIIAGTLAVAAFSGWVGGKMLKKQFEKAGDHRMMGGASSRRGLWLDPRTKILLLLFCILSAMMAPSLFYELGLVVLIGLLGVCFGKWKYAWKGVLFYALIVLLTLWIMDTMTGTWRTMFIAFLGLFHKVYPCGMLSGIVLSTTKVSEFLSAMNRIHAPKKLVIPLAVMLRYVPTIQEDWRFIKDAMRMRDVSPSPKGLLTHPAMTVECIYVPLMMAASKAADELSIASITRGIENPKPRTCLVQIHIGPRIFWRASASRRTSLWGCTGRGCSDD